MGYVEPEAKMNNEGLMSTKIRSLKYGKGVLARSATSSRSHVSLRYDLNMKLLFYAFISLSGTL